MSQRMAVVTLTDAATVTSMPFNEFFLYRATHRKDEREILISCCALPEGLREICSPNVEIHEANVNPIKLRSALLSIKRECEVRGERYAIHMHSPRAAFIALLASIGTGLWKKTLFTVHSSFSGYKLHNKILSVLCALIAERVTCVSEASFAGYPLSIRHLKKKRMRSVPNGVDMERIDKAISNISVVKGTGKIVRFVYVANIRPVKNHGFLLEVLRELPTNIQLIFIGAEDFRKTLRRDAEEMGLLNRIEFTGLIPRDEVFRKILEADVYISPSTLEGLPVSVLEAMYCGLPAILSDIPPHREITKGTDCISVLPLKKETWIREIGRYAAMSHEKRARTGQQCREHIKKHFSLERMHRAYDEIYEELW